MKSSRYLSLFSLLSLIAPVETCAAEDVHYFPATLQNTTLTDGTALKITEGVPALPEEITRSSGDELPNNHWHWRVESGSGNDAARGVFASSGKRGNDAPLLRTTLTGLKPTSDYEIYGGFWVGGFTSEGATPTGNNQWDIRMGCGIADMMGYGHGNRTGFPGTIGCASNPPWQGGLRDKDGDKRLLRAVLGIARTDSKGTLVVYIDDQAEDTNEGRTWYDGIGVVPASDKAKFGSGSPGALHRAVRCGDWEMMRRELEAGADLNALDHDGLTPLFYACVDPNLERIDALLKAGARPDVEEQTFSPLWAAATSGNPQLAARLLAAGADVPLDPLPKHRLRAKFGIESRAHPAVAAICSGSVGVLKLLLDKQPELDLDRLCANDKPSYDGSDPLSYPVMRAVTNNHASMAEYLIDVGCDIEGPEFADLPKYAKWPKKSYNTNGSRSLVIAAEMAIPPMHGVLDALARRKAKLVNDNFDASHWTVLPWDALSAAALAGDADFTSRLLGQVGNVSNDYKTHLLILAQTGADPEVIAMVKNRFGDVTMPGWDGETEASSKQRIMDDARILKPRQIPCVPRKESKDRKVLAVISSPGAEGPAAALTASASAQPGWVCVERQQIEALLAERDFAKPWEDAVQDMSRLGDQLSADLLIIATHFESGEAKVLRLEAVDVRSGLVISRMHLDAKQFKPKEDCENYLADVRERLDHQLAGDSLTAITLLPITAGEGTGSSAALEGMLHAGLLQMIDETPGMIALTREQMQPLAEEKIYKKEGGLWGAAWTIEGGLSVLEGDQVELGLRIRSLTKESQNRDVKVRGNANDLQALVKNAWSQIHSAIPANQSPSSEPAPNVMAQRAQGEASRLLREAEWLHNIKRRHDASPLIDAALYLGADPLKANILRMNIRMDMRTYGVTGRRFGSSEGFGHVTPETPVQPSMAAKAAHALDEYLEMLRINADSLNRTEPLLANQASTGNPKGPLMDFFWNLDIFIYYRSTLQPAQMSPDQRAVLDIFDSELDRHLKRLFALITPSPQGYATLERADQYSYMHYKTVPALPDAMAEAIIRLWDCAGPSGNFTESIHERYFGQIYYQTGRGLIPKRAGILYEALAKALDKSDSPYKTLRKAELAFLRSSGEQRTVAARELLLKRTQMIAGLKNFPSPWIPVDDLERWSTISKKMDGLFNGHELIPELLHLSGAVPDQVFRQNLYSKYAFNVRSIKENTRSAWLNTRGQLGAGLESQLNDILTRSGGREDYEYIATLTDLLDRLYGYDLAREMMPKVLKMMPNEEPKKFGSKNQFPILAFEGTVNAKLLVDVRNGITDQPAMIAGSMVDPKNRHILWIILQPYQDWDFKMDEPMPPNDRSTPLFNAGAPWLVAIDCRNGQAIHKINLLSASGLGGRSSSSTSLSRRFGDLFFSSMVANDTHLLLQMYWRTPEGSMATMVINRETGAVEIVPDIFCLWHIEKPWSPESAQPVVGVGKSFFLVQETRSEETNVPATLLWQVTPSEKPRIVAKSGRRPEESPFDAQDRRIEYIVRDGNRLLAATSWNHVGHYDPQSSTWNADANLTEAAARSHVNNIVRSDFHATLFPQHLFKHTDGNIDAFSGPTETEPGRLKFQNGGGPLYYLPVGLQIPDSYRARFQIENPAENYEWITIADMARSNLVTPVIMNQTETGFIFSSRINWLGRDHVEKERPVHLPFLWNIDKETMLSEMKKAQQK